MLFWHFIISHAFFHVVMGLKFSNIASLPGHDAEVKTFHNILADHYNY